MFPAVVLYFTMPIVIAATCYSVEVTFQNIFNNVDKTTGNLKWNSRRRKRRSLVTKMDPLKRSGRGINFSCLITSCHSMLSEKIFLYTLLYMCMYIYIYIYREREREISARHAIAFTRSIGKQPDAFPVFVLSNRRKKKSGLMCVRYLSILAIKCPSWKRCISRGSILSKFLSISLLFEDFFLWNESLRINDSNLMVSMNNAVLFKFDKPIAI